MKKDPGRDRRKRKRVSKKKDKPVSPGRAFVDSLFTPLPSDEDSAKEFQRREEELVLELQRLERFLGCMGLSRSDLDFGPQDPPITGLLRRYMSVFRERYRSVGAPYGDTTQGLRQWIEEQARKASL